MSSLYHMAGALFSLPSMFTPPLSGLFPLPSVCVSARLSLSPGTDSGLDTRISVTQTAEGTGLDTLTCDESVHGVARG